MKKIRFAFALGNKNTFEDCVFSDAIKYQIIEVDVLSKQAMIISEEINPTFKEDDVDDKAKILIDFLKEKEVKLIVAKYFKASIKLDNKYFIPVIVKSELPDEVVQIILKHIDWLLDELSKTKDKLMIFKIGEGILKYEL